MKIKLYELTQQYQDVLESIYVLNPEATADEVDGHLEGLSEVWSEKALSVAAYCKNIEAEVEAMKSYEKNMRSRRQVVENKLTRLKEYLLGQMEEVGKNKVVGPEVTISIRKCPTSVGTRLDATFSKEYIASTEVKLDKKKIKAAIESGIDIPGAFLINKTSLSIK